MKKNKTSPLLVVLLSFFLGATSLLFIGSVSGATADAEAKLYFTGDISGGGEGSFTPIEPTGSPTVVEVWPQGDIPTQNERKYVGSWNLSLDGELKAEASQEMEFRLVLADGEGTNNEPNTIKVEMELRLGEEGPYLGEQTKDVGQGDTEFIFNSESFNLSMVDGEVFSVLLYVTWVVESGPDPTGPNNLVVKYDGSDYKCGVTFDCKQVVYRNPESSVDTSSKEARVWVDVYDAFGEEDLNSEGYEITITNAEETFTASQDYITFNGKNDHTIEWVWDYGRNEAEEGKNYTAKISSTDIRGNKWKTEIYFEIQKTGGGSEVRYDVSIVSQGGTTKTISPEEKAEFKLKIVNQGDKTDDFYLRVREVTSNQWNYDLAQTFLKGVKPDSYKIVKLQVWPKSENIGDGEEVEITVEVESKGARDEGKEAKDSVTTTTVIEIIRDFNFEMNFEERKYTNFVSPAVFLLYVKNTGNVDDHYSWTFSGQENWHVVLKRSSLEITMLFLENGEDTILTAEVSPEGDPQEGDMKTITIQMRSDSEPGLVKSVTFTVTVHFDLDLDSDAFTKKLSIEQEKEEKISLEFKNEGDVPLEFRFELKSEKDISELAYIFKDENGNELASAIELSSGERKTIYLYIKPSSEMSPGSYTIQLNVLSKKGEKKLTSPVLIEFTVKEKKEETLMSMDFALALSGGGLVAVGIIILVVKKRKKREAKEVVVEAEEEKEKEEEVEIEEKKSPTEPVVVTAPPPPPLPTSVAGVEPYPAPPVAAPPYSPQLPLRVGRRPKRITEPSLEKAVTVGLEEKGPEEEEFIIKDTEEEEIEGQVEEEFMILDEGEEMEVPEKAGKRRKAKEEKESGIAGKMKSLFRKKEKKKKKKEKEAEEIEYYEEEEDYIDQEGIEIVE